MLEELFARARALTGGRRIATLKNLEEANALRDIGAVMTQHSQRTDSRAYDLTLAVQVEKEILVFRYEGSEPFIYKVAA